MNFKGAFFAIFLTSLAAEASEILIETNIHRVQAPAAPVTANVSVLKVGERVAVDIQGVGESFTLTTEALTPGELYQVRVEAVGDSDPYVYINRINGSNITKDDDGGGGLNAQAVFPAPTGPDTRVRIVVRMADEKPGRAQVSVTPIPTVNLALNQETRGRVGGGSIFRAQVTLQAGQSYDLSVRADQESLDTVMVVQGPNGRRVAENDDANDRNLNPFIRMQATETGTYTIFVMGYDGSVSGEFSVRVAPSQGAAAPAVSPRGT